MSFQTLTTVTLFFSLTGLLAFVSGCSNPILTDLTETQPTENSVDTSQDENERENSKVQSASQPVADSTSTTQNGAAKAAVVVANEKEVAVGDTCTAETSSTPVIIEKGIPLAPDSCSPYEPYAVTGTDSGGHSVEKWFLDSVATPVQGSCRPVEVSGPNGKPEDWPF